MPRLFTPIDKLPLVGGALCLDFVNTTGARSTHAPRERLHTYADLLTFCRRTGLLTPSRIRALVTESKANPRSARVTLRRALAIREALHGIFKAAVAGKAANPPDLALFNKELAEAARRRRLGWAGAEPKWEWAGGPTDLDQMLAPILSAAADLLQSDLTNLKQCGECDWLFVDTSRNGKRRWCKTMCGDRVKSRRYYRRHRS